MPVLAAYHSIESAPLLFGCTRVLPGSGASMLILTQAEAGVRFTEQECDVALITPRAYARDSSEVSIVPAAGITSIAPNNLVRLFFHRHLHHIESVGVPAGRSHERDLASIILKEKFDMQPSFSEYRPEERDAARSAFDALLCVGDDSLRGFADEKSYLDLVEEWIDLTELPFVHAVWAVWNTRSTESLLAAIDAACRAGEEHTADVAREESVRLALPGADIEALYDRIDYSLNDLTLESLSEFFRYSFYHGLRADIPDLNLSPRAV